MSEPLLRMQGITKSFPGVRALRNVDFDVRGGEVHALMGENGAGKSTLIKVMTGVHAADGGKILLRGRPISPRSPRQAEALGISTVYQEINLIPHLSVAENIVLGRQSRRWGLLSFKALRQRAKVALVRLDIEIDLNRELSTCSVAVQQMVAIARALDVETRLLVLDEPTSSLDEKEVAELFRVLRNLRAKGIGIIFITHFLDQVYEIADRVTVLRNGHRVGEYDTESLPRVKLVTAMLGRELVEEQSAVHAGRTHVRRTGHEPILQAKGLGRHRSIAPFDLTLSKGEITGLAGLLGSGRTEVARLLFGIDRADHGRVYINGHAVSLRSPRVAIAKGIAFCSEDRKAEGMVPGLSVRENIVLAMQAGRGILKRIGHAAQLEIADRLIQTLDIKVPHAETQVENLSGGNQQKVLLARWLAMEPEVILLDEPTRGIDVGAKAEIEKLIVGLGARGKAVLFISSELEEVVRNCQRVVVLRDRAKVGEIEGEDIDESAVIDMIAGEGRT